MWQASYSYHKLQFITPGGTSRGVLKTKDSWYIKLWRSEIPEIVGVGECSILPALSIDDRPDFEEKLKSVCANINEYVADYHTQLLEWPAIRFGLEVALHDAENGGQRIIFPSGFTQGNIPIPINGLIWMGDVAYMKEQLQAKLESGFNCIKIKVGAIDFYQELRLLEGIRENFSPDEIELRVDANGAFHPNVALAKLKQLSTFYIHSIEQPIKAGQWKQMADLCKESPIPIALDEELIGVHGLEEKERLLKEINPDYIILKPSLLGGFKASEEWIMLAQKYNIGWWATSALEGNVGLNAIAQWTAIQDVDMPQGLGTGQVFSNNIISPLEVKSGSLYYNASTKWGLIP